MKTMILDTLRSFSSNLSSPVNRPPAPCCLFVILPLLACFAFLTGAQAICQEGCDSSLFNAFLGDDALINNTMGSGNTALGWRSLFTDIDGSFNTGVGGGALIFNNGSFNTAVGAAALLLNATGSNNTAIGTDALVNNIVDDNTAVGFFALSANTIGGTLETSVVGFDLGPNTAVGSGALENNVDASANTAVGYNALNSQVTGYTIEADPHLAANTAVGFEALANLTGSATGINALNTALGYQTLTDLTDGLGNVAVGARAGTGLTTGTFNINVGNGSGIDNVTGSFNIFIGSGVGPSDSDETFHTYIDNIDSTSVSGAGTDFVTIDLTTGLLGHLSSSRRYEEDINPMDKASKGLYRLKPVTYRYKKEIDKTQTLAFGLIAEEVAEVNPELVAHNAQGQPESVHYEMVNAMLLNEFLKEHKNVEEQQASISQLKSEMQTMVAQLKEQAAQIQKVSAQLEVSKPASEVAGLPAVASRESGNKP